MSARWTIDPRYRNRPLGCGRTEINEPRAWNAHRRRHPRRRHTTAKRRLGRPNWTDTAYTIMPRKMTSSAPRGGRTTNLAVLVDPPPVGRRRTEGYRFRCGQHDRLFRPGADRSIISLSIRNRCAIGSHSTCSRLVARLGESRRQRCGCSPFFAPKCQVVLRMSFGVFLLKKTSRP